MMNNKDEVFFQALGQQIAQGRKDKHLTQKQLAEHLGIAQQTIAHYEGAKLKISASLLPDLSRLLDRSVEELLGMTKKQDTL